MSKKKKTKITKVCPGCGRKKPWSKRYIVTDGEMGTQEILDRKTGRAFWGSSAAIINDLLDHINQQDADEHP